MIFIHDQTVIQMGGDEDNFLDMQEWLVQHGAIYLFNPRWREYKAVFILPSQTEELFRKTFGISFKE